MSNRTIQAVLIMGVVAAVPAFAHMQSAFDPCVTTTNMQVYSNVFIHRDTGDLLGYELAIKRKSDNEADVLLYVYEGEVVGDGIPLSGQISDNRLNVTGTWVERLREYPSKKEIEQKHAVEIHGALDFAAFQGTLTIDETAEQIRLKHVKRIWSCKNPSPHSKN
jgi:hypothetical protein